jgi:N-acetylneuraminate synthase
VLSGRRVTVIAEAGVNHNGSVERALAMVDAAASAGADVVKFQSFKADLLATPDAPKADYQRQSTTEDQSQLDMLRALELRREDYVAIAERCRQRRIQFLSTPFDLESLRFLVREMDVPALKISSGDLTNGPLLLAAARSGRRILLSTGMATLEEIRAALAIIAHGCTVEGGTPDRASLAEAAASVNGRRAVREKVVLLQCTTEYPAPAAELNLRAITALREQFGTPVGFSDHSSGIAAPPVAVALGAEFIEKHFTLDRSLPGPDHRASLEPRELGAMIEAIRFVEEALGDGAKRPSPSELRNVAAARKSLVATRPIRRGEPFSEENLGARRPGIGISPLRYWDWIGRPAVRDFRAGELVDE